MTGCLATIAILCGTTSVIIGILILTGTIH